MSLFVVLLSLYMPSVFCQITVPIISRIGKSSSYTLLETEEPVSWFDAEYYCGTQRGTNLGSIHSADNNNELLNFCDSCNMWFGLNDIALENNFAYTDSSVVDFTNWNVGHPLIPGDSKDCSVIRGFSIGVNGVWENIDCIDSHLYVNSFICNNGNCIDDDSTMCGNGICKSLDNSYSCICDEGYSTDESGKCTITSALAGPAPLPRPALLPRPASEVFPLSSSSSFCDNQLGDCQNGCLSIIEDRGLYNLCLDQCDDRYDECRECYSSFATCQTNCLDLIDYPGDWYQRCLNGCDTLLSLCLSEI